MFALDYPTAADYLGISERTLHELTARRAIAFHRIGRLVRFTRDDLDAYLAERRVPAIAGGGGA